MDINPQNSILKYDFKEGLPFDFEIIPLKTLIQEHLEMITKPHRAAFYHIIWLTEGSAHHMVDFKTITIHAQELLCIGSDMVHQFDVQSDYDGYMILFTASFFYHNSASFHFLENSPLFESMSVIKSISTKNYAPVFDHLLQNMWYEFQLSKEKQNAEILRNYVHNLLLYAERTLQSELHFSSKMSEFDDLISKFKKLIQEKFTTEKQVQYYTEALHIHEKKLNKATQQILGKTAKEIINDRIVLESKRLLAHSNISIKEIGYQLGFDEPTNFIKYFKKYELCTPFEFRKKHR